MPLWLGWPSLTKRKIPVVVTPYANSTSVAEFAVGSILALAKKLLLTNAVLKDGTYTGFKQVTSNDLWGKTIGVIGIGRIGAEVTRMCRLAFHMNVLAYDPFVTDAWAQAVGAKRVKTLDELLNHEKVILTPHTAANTDDLTMVRSVLLYPPTVCSYKKSQHLMRARSLRKQKV